MVPATGYWSAPLGVTESHIQSSKSCKQGVPLPDYSAIPIPSTVKSYKVTATYNPKTYFFMARVSDAVSGKSLSPWQTYVSDAGNGARDLQRMFCAEGFIASNPESTTNSQIELGAEDDMPRAIEVMLQDDSSLQRVSFVCSRSTQPKNDDFRTLRNK